MAKILVVDDEPDIRLLHGAILRSAGHEVTEAPHGAAALEHILSSTPDVVVSDLSMPVMTGQEMIAAVRANGLFAALPIIVITASVDEAVTGATRMMTKPVDFDSLIAAVMSVF